MLFVDEKTVSQMACAKAKHRIAHDGDSVEGSSDYGSLGDCSRRFLEAPDGRCTFAHLHNLAFAEFLHGFLLEGSVRGDAMPSLNPSIRKIFFGRKSLLKYCKFITFCYKYNK